MRETFFNKQKKARQGGEQGLSGSEQTFRTHPDESHYTKQAEKIAHDAQAAKNSVKSLLGAASKVATGALTFAFPRAAMLAKAGSRVVGVALGSDADEYFSNKRSRSPKPY